MLRCRRCSGAAVHGCTGARVQRCGGVAVQAYSGVGGAAYLLLRRAGGLAERLDRRSTHIDGAAARQHAARCGRAVGSSGGGRVGELRQHHVRAPDVGARRLHLRWAHHAHGHEQPTLVANHARVGHEQLVVGSKATSWQRATGLNGEVVILPRDGVNALIVRPHDRWQRREAVGCSGSRRWWREQRLDAGSTSCARRLSRHDGGERPRGTVSYVTLPGWNNVYSVICDAVPLLLVPASRTDVELYEQPLSQRHDDRARAAQVEHTQRGAAAQRRDVTRGTAPAEVERV